MTRRRAGLHMATLPVGTEHAPGCPLCWHHRRGDREHPCAPTGAILPCQHPGRCWGHQADVAAQRDAGALAQTTRAPSMPSELPKSPLCSPRAAPPPHGMALPRLLEQLAPREHPEGLVVLSRVGQDPRSSPRKGGGTALWHPGTASIAGSGSSPQLLRTPGAAASAIDAGYKQCLPRVTAAAGSPAQPLLPGMPVLKHEHHGS